MQVQNWGVEGLGDLFVATYLFMKESNPHFCVLLQGYAPCQTENGCNAVAFVNIPVHAIFP